MSDVRQFSIVPVPPSSAEDHARAETARKQRLFDWANEALEQLGLAERVPNKPNEFRLRANNLAELSKVAFDVNTAEVALIIRAALYPANCEPKAAHFTGMREGALRRILKLRFNDLRKERATELSGGSGAAGGTRSTAHDWVNDLILDKNGAPRPVLANLVLFLRFHPAWQGVLGFDEFAVKVVIREKSPPWGSESPDTPWADNHESLTRVWFQQEGLFANLGDIGRSVQAAARCNAYHPVRDYFDALKWDGTARLDRWLTTYLHADDSAYTRAVGPRWMISAVVRIYRPGEKVDHMLVLEGQQGKQKSEMLRTLAVKDAWFTDRLSNISSKDAAQEMSGVMLIELAELDAINKASSSASKGFLTRRRDRFRPPYGKHTVDLPRQCIFAGTINPPTGGYLRDATGARRFWPVLCHGVIDRDGIERDRDQLWAEAVTRFKAGEKWWLETPELEALATAEQRARYVVDPWQAQVEDWLAGQKDVTITEVLAGALGLDPKDHSQSSAIRVSKILTHADPPFVRVRARVGPKRENQREMRYRRES